LWQAVSRGIHPLVTVGQRRRGHFSGPIVRAILVAALPARFGLTADIDKMPRFPPDDGREGGGGHA
jgi:hypothetical protein